MAVNGSKFSYSLLAVCRTGVKGQRVKRECERGTQDGSDESHLIRL